MDLPDIAADESVCESIARALEEDIGAGDATTLTLVDKEARIEAVILARVPCIVSGSQIAAAVFAALSEDVVVEALIADGGHAGPEDEILNIAGPARAILTAERTALNFMQRMSGVATLTARFVQRVCAHGTIILDTRKTVPGLRKLEKYAVLCGGGKNHRMGLHDRIMIKDNHRRLCGEGQDAALDAAIRRARKEYPELLIEVEVENEAELASALRAKPDWILLDNMGPDQLRRFVELCKGQTRTEASGGITLDNVEAIAATGVDAISLGCLTHSAPAVDLSLEIRRVL